MVVKHQIILYSIDNLRKTVVRLTSTRYNLSPILFLTSAEAAG